MADLNYYASYNNILDLEKLDKPDVDFQDVKELFKNTLEMINNNGMAINMSNTSATGDVYKVGEEVATGGYWYAVPGGPALPIYRKVIQIPDVTVPINTFIQWVIAFPEDLSPTFKLIKLWGTANWYGYNVLPATNPARTSFIWIINPGGIQKPNEGTVHIADGNMYPKFFAGTGLIVPPDRLKEIYIIAEYLK